MGGVRDLRCARRRLPAERARQPPRARHGIRPRGGRPMGDELHVVFGSGPAGRAVATELTRQGLATTGRQPQRPPGARRCRDPRRRRHRPALRPHGDRTVRAPCTSASTPPHYHRWAEEFPPLQDAVVDAASAAGARLVVLENLYMYGPTGGAPMTESTPLHPTSTKSAVRARMSDELIDAHRAGRVEVVDRTGRRLHRARRDRVGDGRARVRLGARRQEGPHDGSTRHPPLLQLRPRHRPQPRAARAAETTPTDGCGTCPTRRREPSER